MTEIIKATPIAARGSGGSCPTCKGEGLVYLASTWDDLSGLWFQPAYPASGAPPGSRLEPCPDCKGTPR